MLNFRIPVLVTAFSFVVASIIAIPHTAADEPERCMRTWDVGNILGINSNYALLTDRRESVFLLAEMHPACWGIENAPRVILRHRGSRICAGESTTLQVIRTLQSVEETCHVTRLFAVDSRLAAIDLYPVSTIGTDWEVFLRDGFVQD